MADELPAHMRPERSFQGLILRFSASGPTGAA